VNSLGGLDSFEIRVPYRVGLGRGGLILSHGMCDVVIDAA